MNKCIAKIRGFLSDKISSKRVILNFLFVFLMLFYKDFFNSIIYDYLTPNVFNVSPFAFLIYFIVLIIFFVFVYIDFVSFGTCGYPKFNLVFII